jgi:hypothetical protein
MTAQYDFINLTDDVTLVALHGGSQLAGDVEFGFTQLDTQSTNPETDGGELQRAFYRNVSGSMRIAYSCHDDAVAARAAISRLLQQARVKQSSGSGRRVFIKTRRARTDDVYRSEILAGTIAMSADDDRVLIFEFTRRYYFESETLTQVRNRRHSGESFSNQSRVHNHTGALQAQYNRLYLENVTGDIPTPCLFRFYSPYDTYQSDFRDLYVGHFVEQSGELSHVIQGEAHAVQQPSTADQSYSDGYYGQMTLTNTSAIWTGTIPSTFINRADGNFFRLIGFFRGAMPSTTTLLRVQIEQGLQIFWSSDWVTLKHTQSVDFIDFGLAQIPSANVPPSGSVYTTDIKIYSYQETVGGLLGLDYFELMPARSFRHLRNLGYATPIDAYLADFSSEKLLYTYILLSGIEEAKANSYVAAGDEIMLYPNETNVLFFNVSPFTLTLPQGDVRRPLDVQTFYRARKLTL